MQNPTKENGSDCKFIKIGADCALEIEEILRRRANEIAVFHSEYTANKQHLGSVELALTREMARLRGLADQLSMSESGNKKRNGALKAGNTSGFDAADSL